MQAQPVGTRPLLGERGLGTRLYRELIYSEGQLVVKAVYLFSTQDREIFTVKKFSPVAKVAKIKCVKISYAHALFLPLGHAAKIKCANISYVKKKLRKNFPTYGSTQDQIYVH